MLHRTCKRRRAQRCCARGSRRRCKEAPLSRCLCSPYGERYRDRLGSTLALLDVSAVISRCSYQRTVSHCGDWSVSQPRHSTECGESDVFGVSLWVSRKSRITWYLGLSLDGRLPPEHSCTWVACGVALATAGRWYRPARIAARAHIGLLALTSDQEKYRRFARESSEQKVAAPARP